MTASITARLAPVGRVLATLAVLAAFLVVLPLIAFASIFAAPWAVAHFFEAPLAAVGWLVWLAAGLAGLIGLVSSRPSGSLGARAVRARQAMLAAGIGAAVVAVAFMARNVAPPGGLGIALPVFGAAFVVLIVDAGVAIARLQRFVPAEEVDRRSPQQRAAPSFLTMALLSAAAAALGHLSLSW